MRHQEPPFEQCVTASPKRTEAATGISHSTLYRMIRAGEVDTVKVGRSTLIVVKSVLARLGLAETA
jgi:excisionase family DNA binding protein